MTKQFPSRFPWLVLFSRISLFVTVQALFALGFCFAGTSHPWESSANWWPFIVTLVNLTCIGLLMRAFRTEDQRYWDIFRIRKENVLGDIFRPDLYSVLR